MLSTARLLQDQGQTFSRHSGDNQWQCTENFTGLHNIGGTNEKNEKLGQYGLLGGHVTQFWNFGTPLKQQKWKFCDSMV